MVISFGTPLSRMFSHFWQSPEDGGFVLYDIQPMAVSYRKHVRCMDMIMTGVGPCGAKLWQFPRVAGFGTCTASHVRQARYRTMKLP